MKLQKPYYKNLRWKYIKNESRKSYLGNTKQKQIFSAIFRLSAHFGFATPFYAEKNLHARKISYDEIKSIQACYVVTTRF